MPDDTIQLHFQGSAGQSFGAFMPRGMTLMLEGDANDYVGKGLSGGKIIVYPAGRLDVRARRTTSSSATSPCTARRRARPTSAAWPASASGVRNSGVNAVVEAVGDHGCEYMTGGRVVVLGPTGRNFAAGMSGGIAYVLDEKRRLSRKNCNMEMVKLYKLDDPEEIEAVQSHDPPARRATRRASGPGRCWRCGTRWCRSS